MSRPNFKLKDQSGFVSIVVTMILMIVLTLIVLSYARLARREQRSTLDRQLSTQAFYAAESGINDFVSAMENGDIDLSNPAQQTRTNCTAGLPFAGNQTLDSNSNVEYTCVLYNAVPTNLQYRGVTSSHATIIPISNSDLSSIELSWQHTPADATFRTTGPDILPRLGDWGIATGLLKAVLIPRANIQRDNYLTDTFTSYLYPTQAPVPFGNVDYSQGSGLNNSGVLGSARCVPLGLPYACKISVTGLPNGGGSVGAKGWYLVLLSIYQDSDVVVTCNNGAVTPCQGAQIVFDATGKANDVIRRVQVRKPLLVGARDFLPVGFESVNPICKQIELKPPAINDNAACPAF